MPAGELEFVNRYETNSIATPAMSPSSATAMRSTLIASVTSAVMTATAYTATNSSSSTSTSSSSHLHEATSVHLAGIHPRRHHLLHHGHHLRWEIRAAHASWCSATTAHARYGEEFLHVIQLLLLLLGLFAQILLLEAVARPREFIKVVVEVIVLVGARQPPRLVVFAEVCITQPVLAWGEGSAYQRPCRSSESISPWHLVLAPHQDPL